MDAAAVHLVAREDDLDTVVAFLDGDGGGALLLEGPAGIGKTTLWEAGVARARAGGLATLVARGAPEERGLGWVGLADLLAGIDPRLAAGLPEPQRHALEAALLLRPATEATDARAVGAALLATLRLLAGEEPLLVAIDDLHSLDHASASALAFAVRRLADADVRFLLARRTEQGSPLVRALEPDRLRRLPLEPLSLGATRRLIFERLGVALPRWAAGRIHATAQGNPLFALELGRAFAAEPPPEHGEMPLPATLEEIVGARLQRQPAPVRRLLAAAALDPQIEADALPGAEALDAALDAGLLALDRDRVRPSHPLLGSVALARLRPSERRALHRALAQAATSEEAHARHLALATAKPDEEVAAAAAAAAATAAARGAATEAAELGEHALRLTPAGSPERTSRLLAAADYHHLLGAFPRTRELLLSEVDMLPSGATRARALLLLSQVAKDVSENRTLLDRALAESGGDVGLRIAVLAQRAHDRVLSAVAWIADGERELNEVLPLVHRRGGPALQRVLYPLAWTRALQGRPVDDLVALAGEPEVPLHLAVVRVAALRRFWRGELDPARAAFERLLDLADARGEEESYFGFRVQLCELDLRAGRLDDVQRRLDEWALETGGPRDSGGALPRLQAMLAACRGLPGEVAPLAARAIAAEERDGAVWHTLGARRALGIAALLEGDPARAAAELGSVWEHTRRERVEEPGVFPVAPELVEALVGADERDAAAAVLERLERLATEQEHAWALASVHRCRGLVAGDPGELRRAAEGYGRLGCALDRARSLLLLGAALRRGKRRADGRAALEEAAAAFDALGAPGWAAQARTELDRIGGRRRADGLTPTEERVARLVAAGRRNQEVAAELVVSVRAVEANLSRVYAKLGVRSRTELARRLAQDGEQSVGISA